MSTQHDQPPIISKQDAENELASLSARIEDNTQEEESLFQELEKSGSSKDEIDALRNQINFENTKKIQDAYRATEEAYEKKEQEETGQRVLKKLEQVKLSDEDFQNIPEWKSLSDEQKMLVAELATQDALARVQQLGKERFEENTKKAPILSKIKRKIFKSVWITKEEKGALADVQSGKLKPAEKTLQEIIKRTKDLDLSPVGENGKLIIGFMETNNNIPTNERQTLDEYNTLANEFARMPYTWSNEKAANSKDGAIFKKENYTKYKSIEKQYEETKKAVIEINKKAYEAQGIKAIDAAKKAMEDMRQSDMKVQLLQYMTTNPDALGELERINTEASWGRLWNNETVARSGYMLGGWAGRSVAVTALGTMTAPIVASVIGGLRALRRANQKIGTAFEEGLKHETILERKASGKTGTFDDKNANLSIGQKAGKILSGFDVNAKQIGTFVDADMLIHRLDGYEKKLKEAESEEEKQKIITLIQHRIAYIDQKMRAGLINYGSVNPTGENYDLIMRLSKMAVTYMQPDLTIAPEGESDQERIAREKLLAEKTAHDKKLEQILNYNTKRFENRQTTFQTKEIVRGMLLGSTFAVAGMGIRHSYEWVRDIVTGDNTLDATLSEAGNTGSASVNNTEESTAENVAPIDTVENSSIKPIIQDSTISNATSSDVGNISTTETATTPVTPESIPHKPIEVQLSSKGSIQTFLDLKEKLRLEYGKDLAHAPASVQHIMNTNATKLAEEFNMYNPTDVDESMMAPAGSKFIIDEKGNFSYQELGAKDASVLEEGTSAKGTGEYKGKMFDYDKAKTLKVETAQNVGSSTPETPQTNTANIPSQTAEAGAPAQALHQSIDDIFPSDQEIQGTPRDAFRALVNNHYESTQGETWKNLPQADKNAEVWMYEKFGKVTVGQTPDGRMSISNPIDPTQNLGIDLKSVPVAEAIKTNATVASGIADLQKIARAQLGYDMVIDKNESTSSYIHRVFTSLESASQEQPEAPALEEEINRMGRPGKILPGDYMADQSQEEYMGETSVNQTEVSASNSSEANQSGEDGGLGRAEKGPGTGKVYTETLEETKNPIKWEKYRDHKIITADDVKGRNEVIGISPNTNDRGITYRDWNRVFDNKIVDPEADNVKFGSYNQYETERELQLLFGKGEKIGNTINMSYFREQPEWKTVSKVPARYFFNELFGNEYVSHYPREISDAQLEILKKAGLVRDVNVVDPTTGAVTRSMQFTHHAELARLAQAYRHINPDEAQPYPNETIEDYVGRLMKKVHQTQDGSFFARKHDINFDEAGQSMQQQAPTQQMPVYTPDNPGIISPTRGIYNTGGSSPSYGPSNYGPSYYGPQGNYNPQYGPQGFNTGSTRGDVIVGGVGVAQVALNEGVNAINGNTQTGGGKRILNSAVQTGVQIGVNGIMRQIFGNGGGYYGGGSNWQ